jgi:hypothetical protein
MFPAYGCWQLLDDAQHNPPQVVVEPLGQGSPSSCALALKPPNPIAPKKANPKTNDLILLIFIVIKFK